jgi:hypothetical protein
MKITEALDQLLRARTAQDGEPEQEQEQDREQEQKNERPEPITAPPAAAGERPLPAWVRRAQGQVEQTDAPAAEPQAVALDGPAEGVVEDATAAVAVTDTDGAAAAAESVSEPASAEVVPELRVVEEAPAAEDAAVVVETPVAVDGDGTEAPDVAPEAPLAPAVEAEGGDESLSAEAVEDYQAVDLPAWVAEETAMAAEEPAPETELVPGSPVAEQALPVLAAPAAGALARLEASAAVVESLNLGYHLGAAVDRIAAAAERGSEGAPLLREAAWLIDRYVQILEQRPLGADLHASGVRLARTGESIQELKALAADLDDCGGG